MEVQLLTVNHVYNISFPFCAPIASLAIPGQKRLVATEFLNLECIFQLISNIVFAHMPSSCPLSASLMHLILQKLHEV